tara:strand:- start:143 stop:979 length:837 start_codon:yes stop_codon:yes gene_type:complete
MIRVALTHDVDRVKKSYQYFTYSLKYLLKGDIRNMFYHINSFFGEEPYWNFERIIEIENHLDVKSTFFFLNESIKFDLFNIKNWKLSLGRYDIESEKIKNIIRLLDKDGWEIGLHGSYNSYKSSSLLQKEKKVLEKIVGHKVIGIRQHYLNLDNKTWKRQQSVGFKYDASWGPTTGIGFKDNKVSHFYPLNNKFVVFPLQIMDSCFMDIKDKWEEFIKIIEEINEKDGLLVLNWHHRTFNEKEFPEFSKFYIKMIKELKKRNASFHLLSDYYAKIDKQ